LKIAFKIPPHFDDIADLHLLLELSNNQISVLFYSKNPFALKGYYIYELEKHIHPNVYAEELKIVSNDEFISNQRFSSFKILFNFSTATLVPTSLFIEAEKENILNLMFGKDVSSYCFCEDVIDNDIKLIYRIHSKIYELVNELFPANKFSHSSSLQLSTNNKNRNSLECIVYHNQIKVILCKNNQVQIVQFFEFDTPIDVSYHLLNVCERFALTAVEVNLFLSGMIVEKSNMYDDIHKYFLHIHFANLSADLVVAEEMKIYPSHFYHNLIVLTQCVS
jgi:Protein of unknown function (DUF3822)